MSSRNSKRVHEKRDRTRERVKKKKTLDELISITDSNAIDNLIGQAYNDLNISFKHCSRYVINKN